ncbi:MAG TPA: MarR family transcriptional regulator [Agitococcus sp.]|jgi:DNA-binding MarR family transcriptional regulator|nr:MarR family transcriptional regulator [Moraxellaceae bacterium]MBL0231774.1 MarR family transcriptional regulator [Moraxellaceae bacterium]MCC6374371.1 MarR family transcriptional regulator [Moraxellaceae bacterium]HQV80920.1 MarR family transcriptional regulator [Agitococcus sp.]
MEHSPAPAYEIRMLRAIRRIIRAVDMHSKMLQQAQDITAPQLVCLLTLLKEGALTMKRLSQLIDLSASTTVGVVDRLEVKGLVSRTRSTHDRRQVFVSITVDGEAMAKRSPFPLQSRLIDGFQKMPELEQATLTLAVERLVSLMGAGDIDASAILDLQPIAEASDIDNEEHHP